MIFYCRRMSELPSDSPLHGLLTNIAVKHAKKQVQNQIKDFECGSPECLEKCVTVPKPKSVDPAKTDLASAVLDELKNINRRLDSLEKSLNSSEPCEYSEPVTVDPKSKYFDFSVALDQIKNGNKVTRVNKQGAFIEAANVVIDSETSSSLVHYDPSTRFREVYNPTQDDLFATDWTLY